MGEVLAALTLLLPLIFVIDGILELFKKHIDITKDEFLDIIYDDDGGDVNTASFEEVLTRNGYKIFVDDAVDDTFTYCRTISHSERKIEDRRHVIIANPSDPLTFYDAVEWASKY